MPEESKNSLSANSPRTRLQVARERSGKSPEELASAAGINAPSYYDLEWVDGEIESGLPLGALQKLCAEIRIRSSDLFTNGQIASPERISLDDLVTRIKNHLEKNHQAISEFEAKIGFEISRCLEDSSSILEWDIECLQSVCTELSVDWKLALS